MFRRLRRTPLLGDHLPFEDFLSPQAMLLTDGSACAAFEVDGIPAETAGDAIARLHEDLCQTLRNVADGRLTLAVKLCRGLADPAVLPPIPPRAPAFAEALLLGYGDALLDGSLYSNRLFLCAEWAPAQPAGKWAGRQAERIAGAAEENAAARLASLERVCAAWAWWCGTGSRSTRWPRPRPWPRRACGARCPSPPAASATPCSRKTSPSTTSTSRSAARAGPRMSRTSASANIRPRPGPASSASSPPRPSAAP